MLKLHRHVRTALFAIVSICAAPVLAGAPSVPPLDAYGDLPGVEQVAISPGGSHIAIVGNVADKRRVMVLDPNEKLVVHVPIGETKTRYVQWIGDEAVMVVNSGTQNLGLGFTTDKHEFYNAIVLPIDGSKPWEVFGKQGAIPDVIFGNMGTRSVAGKLLGYFGGIEFAFSANRMEYEFDHGRPALFAVDLRTGSAKKIAPAPSEGQYRDWLVDGSGEVGARLEVLSDSGRWTITNSKGKALASGVDPTGGISLISFGRDGTSVIYSVSDDQNAAVRWFEVPLAGGAPAEVFEKIDIERIYTDPANGRLLGYLERGATPKPVLFDPAHQEVIRSVYRAFPRLNAAIIGWSTGFRHVLVRTSGNEDSGTWYLVDMAKRAADDVGIDRPRIAPQHVGPISTVAYRAADGLELDGILTLPPGREAKNLPVIMFPHGGPSTHDEAVFDWWAQAFASRGYAVFQPNFRGSTNRDEGFRRAGNGEWGRKMQTDISDGLAHLAKLGIIDPRRACIMGASYGGYAALAGVTLQSGLYRCAVAVAPVSDLADMYWTDFRESGRVKMVRRQLDEQLGSPARFAEVSPRKHATQADAPILVMHGKDDTVVPFRQGQAMIDALKDAGKPHAFVILREEDHWLSRAATRKQMLTEAMAFVNRYNPAD